MFVTPIHANSEAVRAILASGLAATCRGALLSRRVGSAEGLPRHLHTHAHCEDALQHYGMKVILQGVIRTTTSIDVVVLITPCDIITLECEV